MLRLAAIALAFSLPACASSERFSPVSSTPGGPSVISGAGTGTTVQVAGPAGCSAPISEYQQLIDGDAQTGHLNPGVYNRVVTDLEPVKRACAEGREADARNQLAAVKSRYGYR